MFAIFVLAVVAATTLAPSYTECDEGYKGETRDPDQGKPKPETHRTFTEHAMAFAECEGEFLHKNEGVITAVSTILIALFTLTLWRATSRLWEAGERQFGLAEKQFLATHRPEIVAHTFEVSRDFHDGEGRGIGASFMVVNKGTADATIRDIFGRTFLTEQLRPGASLPSLGYEGRELTWGNRLLNVAIFSSSDVAAAVDMDSGYGKPGNAKLWCIGRIAYEDEAGRGREAGFCLSYDTVGERWVQRAKIRLRVQLLERRPV